MKLINFKVEDDFFEILEAETKLHAINKSEFYRACLERGFEEITNYKYSKEKHLVAFYVDAKRYQRLVQIVSKYKLKLQKVLPVVFEAGFDFYKTIDFIGFMKVAKGIVVVEDAVKKILGK